MQKRASKSKINGKIIMMQNDLMLKLANLESEPRTSMDQLGFPQRNSQFDSLTNLLSKAKQVTETNKGKIQVARKNSQMATIKKVASSKRQSQTGTFLTGVGLASEHQQKIKIDLEDEETKIIYRNYYTNPQPFEQQDPDEMIKQMIKRSQQDDLAQLRKMIKQTDCSLQDYGKQLKKTRKEVLGMAQKFCDIDYNLVDKICRYEDRNY